MQAILLRQTQEERDLARRAKKQIEEEKAVADKARRKARESEKAKDRALNLAIRTKELAIKSRARNQAYSTQK